MTTNATNPFDNDAVEFLVLTNHEDQHSLWPSYIDVPNGWDVAYGPSERSSCLDYVTEHWTDITPKSRRLARLTAGSDLGEAV